MSLYKTDIISIDSLSKNHIFSILSLAKDLKNQKTPIHTLRNKLLASVFFEPSTRTRLSFEAAMLKLGGSVIGHTDKEGSSMAKGESLQDYLKVISSYADVLVIRHPSEGSAQLAADVCDIPVINAGDGANEHPTQTLLDLFSIQECQHRIDDLKIAFVGDLKYGRTVHSLVKACSYFNIRLYFISPEALMLPDEICHELSIKGMKYSFHKTIEEIIDRLDIIYMTRVQKERFNDMKIYEKTKLAFSLNLTMLKSAKPNLKILHPLPRVFEIDPELDNTPYAYYFQQAKNGVFIRQALLLHILNENKQNKDIKDDKSTITSCSY